MISVFEKLMFYTLVNEFCFKIKISICKNRSGEVFIGKQKKN